MGKAKNKRKHSKAKSRPKAKDKEVVDYGWAEIVRKGRHVFVKNKMTAEEHAAYLVQLKENRPKLYEEIKEMIDEVVGLINGHDKIFVLGGIAAHGYFRMNDDPADDGKSEVAIEYCHSIATATPNTNKGLLPDVKTLNRIFELLETIRLHFSYYFAVEHVTGKYSAPESRTRLHMISNSLFIRGEGYYRHIKELFCSMFNPHDAFLVKKYGFSSTDVLQTFEKLEECFLCRVRMPDGSPHIVQTAKIAKWMAKNNKTITPELMFSGKFMDEFHKDNPEIVYGPKGVMLCYINSIDTLDELFKIRHFNAVQEKVVKQLSIKFGDNKEFSLPEKYKYEVLNKSLITTRPIVEDEDGNYYLFPMNLAARNFFVIVQDLIKKADPEYFKNSFLGKKVKIAKDEFIEQKTFDIFSEMLPNVSFYRNVQYKYMGTSADLKCTTADNGVYELDILGVSENATYLIEVKAGLISEEAKRGAIKSIKTDMTSIIGDAICQSHRALLFIQSDPNAAFQDINNEDIKVQNRNTIFKISISFSYAGNIISDLTRLQKFGILDERAGFAWTVNIFDLIPFSKLMVSESEFIDYLTNRIPMYADTRLEDVDEMNMLGLYFHNDLKIDREMKNSTTVRLNAYKDDIDRYFDRGGKKPEKRKPVKN